MTADLSQGLASLGAGIDSLTSGIQGWQKRSALAELGNAIQNNDTKAAMAAAAKLGDTGTMMSLAKLGQAQESAKIFNDQLPGLVGGGSQPAGIGALAPSTGASPATSSSSASFDPQKAADAIASIESSGTKDPYSVTGPKLASGDYANGRYQVMASNVGPWTKEVLGSAMTPEQFRANPQAQDAVFHAKFGQAVQKFGNIGDAASVWFTGRPLAQGGNASDVNGMTGSQYVRRFAQAYNAKDGGTQVASAGPSFAPQGGATAYAPTGSQGGPDTGGNPDDAAKAIAANSSDPKAVATATYLTAQPSGSSERITRLAKLASLPGLGEGQQKIVNLLLQQELESSKATTEQKNFLFAKTRAGGSFQGGFVDFQKRGQDRGDTIESAITARAKIAPQYGLQPGTPEHRDFVLNGKTPGGDNLETQVATRTKLAPQFNLQPGTSDYNQYVANGKLPDQSPDATPEMKASEQKMFAAAQEKTRILSSQIEDLNRAMELNGKAYSGNYAPGLAAGIARNAPFGLGNLIVDPDRVAATTEFNNLVGAATLSQGKELFGARVTNYDEKLMQDLKARPDMTPQERAVILNNMIAHRKQVLSETAQDVADMRAGTRFQKGPNAGGGAPGYQPAPAPALPPQQPPQPSVATPPQRMTMPSLEGNGASTPVQPRPGVSQPQGQPGAQAGPAPQQAGGSQPPVRVSTPQEAASLPSGTTFVTPDGRLKVRP